MNISYPENSVLAGTEPSESSFTTRRRYASLAVLPMAKRKNIPDFLNKVGELLAYVQKSRFILG